MLKTNISDEVIKKTLLDYFMEIEKYTPNKEELERIKRATLVGRRTSLSYPLLRQSYDLFGFEDEKTSIYLNFVDLIQKHFSIDRDVIEIAGGPIPRLSFHIASRQTKGKVTVYDPLMYPVENKLNNLVIKKEPFTEQTIVPKNSLIIGFMPCEATELLIKYATEHKLDFMVALCGCPPITDYYGFDDDVFNDWDANMKYLAMSGIEDNNLGIIGYESLKELNDPYPILFNKKVKKFTK